MSNRLRELFREFLTNNSMSDFSELRDELGKPENNDTFEDISFMKYFLSQAPAIDKEKMWAEISRYRNAGRRRKITARALRYAAVFMLPLLAAGVLWYTGVMIMPKPAEVADAARIEPGKRQAIIWIEDKEYIDISNISRDTAIRREGYAIKLTAGGEISYEYDFAETGDTVVPADVVVNRVFIPRGGEHSLTLPDGSRVWLNSDTELRFTVPFTGVERRVRLKGEAYFEIAHNPDRPFIVEKEDISLRVLGTRFNIKGYPGESTQATLVEGSLGISYGGDKYLVLTPNEQFVYNAGLMTVREVDVQMYTSWMDGRFYFDSTSLGEISRQMERWYNITFVFIDDSLKEERFTGVIERKSSANEVMETLRKIIEIQYDIKDRTIYVFRKNADPQQRRNRQ